MWITVETKINASLEHVWQCWTEPAHISSWNFASDDWCCPRAENDARSGGTFNWRMEAKDGSFGFDFSGTYDRVVAQQIIEYTLGDGRKVKIEFAATGKNVTLSESFEAEGTNSDEMQRTGWQAILENFRKHAESCQAQP
jgi:uncharacterized protein YndB with AHSA1/START domain